MTKIKIIMKIKKTKEKMLCKPKVMKNYTKNIYYFKIEDK